MIEVTFVEESTNDVPLHMEPIEVPAVPRVGEFISWEVTAERKQVFPEDAHDCDTHAGLEDFPAHEVYVVHYVEWFSDEWGKMTPWATLEHVGDISTVANDREQERRIGYEKEHEEAVGL